MEELDPDDEAEDLLALLDSAWESQDLRGMGGLMNDFLLVGGGNSNILVVFTPIFWGNK